MQSRYAGLDKESTKRQVAKLVVGLVGISCWLPLDPLFPPLRHSGNSSHLAQVGPPPPRIICTQRMGSSIGETDGWMPSTAAACTLEKGLGKSLGGARGASTFLFSCPLQSSAATCQAPSRSISTKVDRIHTYVCKSFASQGLSLLGLFCGVMYKAWWRRRGAEGQAAARQPAVCLPMPAGSLPSPQIAPLSDNLLVGCVD
jgi:hypothetical protein